MWQSLVKTALLGTQRAQLPHVTAVSPLTELLAQLDQSDPEAALLNMAAILDLHEQVGQVPAQINMHTEVQAQDDEKPEPPPYIARRLNGLLEGRHSTLLPEFLQLLAAAGFRVPTLYLPNLLEKGAKTLTIRPLIPPVLGQCGRRLAAQNREWHYAILDTATWQGMADQWQQTMSGKRYTLLRQLRETAPDKGRQLLETTWRNETNMIRSQLIKLLQINISMADEPFLERALDDRNHLVRIKAAELLTHLPQSRLCRRMQTNTKGLLVWTPRGNIKIQVNFPRVLSNAMIRDGILNHAKMDKTRLRTRQLIQMVTAVPLEHWTTGWRVTAADIVQVLADTRWQRTLTSAFTTAAMRRQNVVWAKAILQHIGIRDQTARLVSILPADDFQALVEEITQQFTIYPSLDKGKPARLLLSQWPHNWNEDTVRYWLKLLAHYMTHKFSEGPHIDPTMNIITRKFARLCPPSLVAETVQQLDTAVIQPGWIKSVNELINTLQFREEMARELASS
ncbi:MAG: DUF5691 domain-containing protein [Anaerolineae bacterium]